MHFPRMQSCKLDWPLFLLATKMAPSNSHSIKNITCFFYFICTDSPDVFWVTQMHKSGQSVLKQNVGEMINHQITDTDSKYWLCCYLLEHLCHWTCFAGDHSGGHGGPSGLRPGQRPRLRCDGCQESPTRSWSAGFLQVREVAHDPYAQPLGGEGVERPMER